jgi:hypothetical protein
VAQAVIFRSYGACLICLGLLSNKYFVPTGTKTFFRKLFCNLEKSNILNGVHRVPQTISGRNCVTGDLGIRLFSATLFVHLVLSASIKDT